MVQDMTDGLQQALDLMIKEGEKWEPGDQDFVVCRDGVVIVEMGEDRTLKVNVICGVPKITDIKLGLMKE